MADELQRQRFIREYREAWERAALGLPDEFVAALQRERELEDAADEAASEREDADRALRGERDQDVRA